MKIKKGEYIIKNAAILEFKLSESISKKNIPVFLYGIYTCGVIDILNEKPFTICLRLNSDIEILENAFVITLKNYAIKDNTILSIANFDIESRFSGFFPALLTKGKLHATSHV